MYIDLPQLPFSLNVSRAHGRGDIDDETLDQYPDDEQRLKQLLRPGSVYVFGWNRSKSEYVDQLPASLASFIAERLVVDVSVFNRRINLDIADGEPVMVVSPTHGSGS